MTTLTNKQLMALIPVQDGVQVTASPLLLAYGRAVEAAVTKELMSRLEAKREHKEQRDANDAK